MSFRTKLFLVFLITVLASVSLVSYGVTHYTQAAFEEADAQRSEVLVAQFTELTAAIKVRGHAEILTDVGKVESGG